MSNATTNAYMGAWTSIDNIIYEILLAILHHFIFKLFYISIEYKKYKMHYPLQGRMMKVVTTICSWNKPTKWFFSLYLLFLMPVITKENFLENFKDYFFNNFHRISVIVLIYEILKPNHGNIDLVNWIRSGNGLDYATGMASNYFHGYIFLQTPNKGDGKKGIRERIADYEDKHDLKMAINKLFILVPDSLHIKPKIESAILERASYPLETMTKDRAGVQRPFKNDVYRFKEKINDQHYYIALEGATPLLSFYEAMNNSLTGTTEMKEMHREILFQFYKSLKKFTSECPDTRHEVEIVYYHDVIDGKEVDVGEVLKTRIQKMLDIERTQREEGFLTL